MQLEVQPRTYLLKGLVPVTYEAGPASQRHSSPALDGISYTVVPNRFVLTVLVFLAAPLVLLIFAFVDRLVKHAHAKGHVIARATDRDR